MIKNSLYKLIYVLITAFLAAIFSLSGPYSSVLAEKSMDDPHAHHKHMNHDHHMHHKIPQGVARTTASYMVPEVTLVNQHGEKVRLSQLLDTDQPVMLNFIFTTCTAICPAMSATFASVQTKLGEDSQKLRMISVSIDPEYDTPAALNDYAKRFKAGPQWAFLTGSLDDSVAVQKAFDADRGDKMNHAPMTLLRASGDSEWIRYEGFAKASDLAEEARNML
jgi:protein SCO1/2